MIGNADCLKADTKQRCGDISEGVSVCIVHSDHYQTIDFFLTAELLLYRSYLRQILDKKKYIVK